jgi:peptide/nickel transport system substrate-binding protein
MEFIYKKIFLLFIILVVAFLFFSCLVDRESVEISTNFISSSDNHVINQDGILRVGYFTSLTSLDGFQAIGGFERMIFFISNEPLFAIGKDGIYEPNESLASSFKILEQGKKIRVFLREGVFFHNDFGEMTANDVVFSLNRIHQKGSGFGAPGLFRTFSYAEYVDRYTVDLIMNVPDANIIKKFFERSSLIHSKKNWIELNDPAQHKNKPIGTGPYKVAQWVPGIKVEYIRHEDWWQGIPKAKKIVVSIIPNSRTRLNLLKTGNIDLAWLQSDMVDLAQKESEIQVWSYPGVGFDGWIYANGLPPFDDLRMRRAALKAIDATFINESVYRGTMLTNHSWHTFPENSYYGVNLSSFWNSEFLNYDLDYAKSIVNTYAEEKGLDLPIKIKGVCDRREDRMKFCEALKESWGKIGLEFEFDLAANSAERMRIMSKCEVQVMQGGSGIALPHQMERLLHSSGRINVSGNTDICNGQGHSINNEVQIRLDNILDKAATEFDLEKQANLYKIAQEIALKNLWTYVPILLRVNYIGCNIKTTGGCENSNPHRGDGFVRISDFWVKEY